MSAIPAYSICIPNYNHADYLRRKIPQCLAQTVMPAEILVIDDGSTDDSREVVAEFAREHPSVRLIALPHNIGVNATIMTALKSASSDFVALSSTDDHLAPDFAEHLMGILAQHRTAGFAFSDPAEWVETTDMRREVPLHLASRPAYFSPQQFSDLLTRNYFSRPSHASIYRRQALLDLNGFNPELEWYADWVAGYVLAFLHGVCYVPKTLAHFTIRDESISGIGRLNAEKQKIITAAMLNTLQRPPYAAVRDDFRKAALLTEYRLRALPVVWRTDPSYLTLRLVWRILLREAWHHIMPYVPLSWRQKLRRLLGQMTRR